MTDSTGQNKTNYIKYKSEVTLKDGERYYIDQEDKEYISVTSLLSKYEDKKFLTIWKNKIGEESANAVRDEAATRGKETHKIVESYLLAGSVPSKEGQYSNYAQLALDCFYSKVLPFKTEEVVFYRDRLGLSYAGRYDSVVYIDKGVFKTNKNKELEAGYYLVDLKTKNKMPRLDIPDYMFKNFLQGCAYSKAIDFNIKGFVLVFVTNKKCKLVFIDDTDLRLLWEVFYKILADYYGVYPLEFDWNNLMFNSLVSFDLTTGDIIKFKHKELNLIT